ncbi:MAG: hypothetical protein Q4C67_01525 [Deinococcus sp.]|nr:hypothetical protein [Deinococcus sp.]
MRRLALTTVACALMGTAAAEMLAADTTNVNFNRFLAAQKLPVCQPGTYFSFLSSSAPEYTAPREASAEFSLALFRDFIAEGRQVLRQVAALESLTLYVQSADGTHEVYKETYIDGYALQQNCQVKPAAK